MAHLETAEMKHTGPAVGEQSASEAESITRPELPALRFWLLTLR
jgi:hypothetical protein